MATLDFIRKTVNDSDEYKFLRENKHLGNNIVLLGMGGSHAYGTERESSDIDIRGIATNSPRSILAGLDFEQVVDVPTDTTIYSVDKMFKLLCSCNPNAIEILGLKDEHYLYVSKIGRVILDNKDMFLSKKVIHTFGGYANAQLRRMENKAARTTTQGKQEENIMKSIEHALVDIRRRHKAFDEENLSLYVDDAENEEFEKELFIDLKLSHYPLRDYVGLHSEMLTIVKEYSRNNHRNTNAITHDKLGKHMMHLVRLYLMCFDILEKGEIITYRKADLPLLTSIRDGEYLNDGQPTSQFYELLDEMNKRFDIAIANAVIPDVVDMERVYDVLATINRMVVEGDV